jgi:hypothetical protein
MTNLVAIVIGMVTMKVALALTPVTVQPVPDGQVAQEEACSSVLPPT